MELEEALKVGFLFIPPHNFLRKTWMKRYCALYNASKHGIQRIELFETEEAYVKQNPSKIIPLIDCWKVTPLPQKHQANVFEVRTKSNSYQFSADTFQDMSEWLASLQKAAFSKTQVKPLVVNLPTSEEKQEENLLYCSMDEPEVYAVTAVPTEAILRNYLKGDYKLIVTSVNFSIAEECLQGRIGKVILTWPYRHIRRYGCSTENFSFEAGRKCASGEGLFTFATSEGMKIFQSVDSHVSALKSTQGEIDIPNSPSTREDKNNFFTSKDSLNSKESFFQTLNKSEHSLSHKSNPKSLPPFSKPPRKSKSGAFNNGSDKTLKVGNTSTQDSSSQYAEICRRNSTDFSFKTLEAPHINNAHFDTKDASSKVPEFLFPSNTGEVLNVSQAPYQTDVSSYIENLRLNEVSRKDVKVKRAHSSSDYENCDFSSDNSPLSFRSAAANEHTYGKLSNTRQSAPSNTGNLYGSILSSANPGGSTSPVYSNISYIKQSSNISGIEHDPEHF